MTNGKKNKWYYSKTRFYVLNCIWNYGFWLNAKRVYKEVEYRITNENGFYTGETKRIKKFVGYFYKGNVYLDNPGLPIKDRELWENWRKKGLIE